MQTENATPTKDVYRAICAVMGDIGREGIGKNRKNQGQGFQFRGIDDVYNALNPLMAKHGLVMLPRITERDCQERTTAKGGIMFYVTVRGHFDLVSSADGSMHTVEAFGEAMDSADKATNKAMSAAYKYAAFQAFCIPTEGNDDADAHTPEPIAPRASRADIQLGQWKLNVRDAVGAAKTVADLESYIQGKGFTERFDDLDKTAQERLLSFIADRRSVLWNAESGDDNKG